MIKKIILLIFLLSIFNCSLKPYLSVLSDGEPIPQTIIAINSTNTFIPDEIKNAVNNDTIKDFITRNLRLAMPDTVSLKELYNIEDPVFAPISLDSGILLCNRDLALYINDKAWRRSLQKEVSARKKFEVGFVLSAMGAEVLYNAAIMEANKINYQTYDEYLEERKYRLRWKKVSGILGLLFIGYMTSQIIN